MWAAPASSRLSTRLDLRPEAHEFLGEMIFCTKEGAEAEDEGYVLGISMNGKEQSSDLLVFDAKSVKGGPICGSTWKSIGISWHFIKKTPLLSHVPRVDSPNWHQGEVEP